VAKTEEEEPSLFLVRSTTVQKISPPAASVSAATSANFSLMATVALSSPDVAPEDHRLGSGARPPRTAVELKEERVFA
jgi:hypothetical protein